MTKEEARAFIAQSIKDDVDMARVADALNVIESCDNSQDFGKWIKHDHADEDNGYLIPNYECSCCHMWFRDKTNYCPSCGILMKDGED